MKIDHKVDKNSYLRQFGEDNFETYEKKKTKSFINPGKLTVFMSKLIVKADKLDFRIKYSNIPKDGGSNSHLGLFPKSKYNFSGELELEKEGDDRIRQDSHDIWRISVYDNGNIISQYKKQGQIPKKLEQQKEFMKKYSIDRLLN